MSEVLVNLFSFPFSKALHMFITTAFVIESFTLNKVILQEYF